MHDVRPFLPAPFGEPGSLLYVGYRPDACSWLQELHDAGNEVSVLEAWKPNADAATHDLRIKNCLWGDVREELPFSYDYVWWWHGPEHVGKDEFPRVLGRLLARTGRLLACAAPWGVYEQGAHAGNPHERHLWSVYEADFQAAGLETRTDGAMDQPGSEIVGWVSRA